jgi:hypothetical protein
MAIRPQATVSDAMDRGAMGKHCLSKFRPRPPGKR